MDKCKPCMAEISSLSIPRWIRVLSRKIFRLSFSSSGAAYMVAFVDSMGECQSKYILIVNFFDFRRIHPLKVPLEGKRRGVVTVDRDHWFGALQLS